MENLFLLTIHIVIIVITALPVDIVFAIDVSNSMQSSDLSLITTFLNQFVDGFQVATYLARFGFVSYSDSANVIYRLDQSQTSAAVKSAISNYQLSSSSSHNLVSAIQLSLAGVGMLVKARRSYAPQVSYGSDSDEAQLTHI